MTAVPKPTALARAAAAYAVQGWYVFPLTVRGKAPMIGKSIGGRGFLDGTTDAQQIAEWWGRLWPHANIGLWPGQSGYVVIDIDGPEGEATARALGLLAEPTLVCTTGRPEGGRHLYFKRPPFSVSNVSIGHKLDVRGDAGYVILPPSIHPTGTPYRWLGRVEEIRELPPKALQAIQQAQAGAATPAAHGHAAKEIALLESIPEGGRNNTLTRYAGRLLAHGIGDEEVLALVASLNATRCRPPLPQHEVNALVASIATKERAKRAQSNGRVIRLVTDDAETAPPPPDGTSVPDFAALAAEQITAAKALLRRDLSGAPLWGWADLRTLLGPMLPGELIVVASLMGNGKSTLLMSQMEWLAETQVSTLYVPLEVDPEACRLRWAAWKLHADVAAVMRGQWERLPEGTQEAIDGILDEQEANPFVHFAAPRRISYAELARWCRKGRDDHGVSIVMLDHFHRMDFGPETASYRVTVTETVRRLKDLARDLGIVLLCAAQLNRSADPLDRHLPPQSHRLKESAGIGEEADVIAMLSRRLRPDITDGEMKAFRLGHKSERDIEAPNTMAVTCRKHRLDDTARDRTALLYVQNGRLEAHAPTWRGE